MKNEKTQEEAKSTRLMIEREMNEENNPAYYYRNITFIVTSSQFYLYSHIGAIVTIGAFSYHRPVNTNVTG